MIKSRFSHLKWTTVVVVLAITIIAGALLVYGHANPPDGKFSVQDATTREGNGKRLRAKAGFELVKDGEGVSARRRSKPTESSADSYRCQCTTTSGACNLPIMDPADATFTCTGDSCCKFVKVSR